MKYHDSMEQAQQKMTEVCWFLERYKMPPIPINYHVAYSYISKNNDALNQDMEQLLADNKELDSYVMEDLFSRHLAEQDKSQKAIIKGIDLTLNAVEGPVQTSSQSVSKYISTLDDCLDKIDHADKATAKQIIDSLVSASYDIKHTQQELQEALLIAQKESKKAQKKLLEIEESRHIDPLTGLYKSSLMVEKAQVWIEQKRSICAISIDIDDFNLFNKRYGHVIGDVVLNKIAKKVRSYVQESGLPVRTRGEEFMILLPDVTLQTASEIANKMRSGVEKLKFISSRSGKRLPKLTVSLGVSELAENSDLLQLTSVAYNGMKKAKLDGKNKVVCLT